MPLPRTFDNLKFDAIFEIDGDGGDAFLLAWADILPTVVVDESMEAAGGSDAQAAGGGGRVEEEVDEAIAGNYAVIGGMDVLLPVLLECMGEVYVTKLFRDMDVSTLERLIHHNVSVLYECKYHLPVRVYLYRKGNPMLRLAERFDWCKAGMDVMMPDLNVDLPILTLADFPEISPSPEVSLSVINAAERVFSVFEKVLVGVKDSVGGFIMVIDGAEQVTNAIMYNGMLNTYGSTRRVLIGMQNATLGIQEGFKSIRLGWTSIKEALGSFESLLFNRNDPDSKWETGFCWKLQRLQELEKHRLKKNQFHIQLTYGDLYTEYI